ncbi:MAG TPA: GH1 family beta-glucosidase [Chloroflexia bacterium]|nr:GH1 family beta-glucosidase [Chloroflexia bacterium]
MDDNPAEHNSKLQTHNSALPQKGGFTEGFVWGAATAAFQIEGSTHADGRGESIWDRFCSLPGRVHNGDTGEPACDHYRLWREDVDMLDEMGVGAYRFSVAWPRIFPEGRGAPNQRGLDFYDRLVDALLERGIAPFVTLYHWDLPQALQDRGGWRSRDTAESFARYADAVVRRLGDRAGHWITHNEPAVAAFHGYLTGEHAPGFRDWRTAMAAAHNLLLSHGLAMQAIRAAAPRVQAGITLNLYPFHPASGKGSDEEAAQRGDGFQNRWFLDPVLRGRYPDDMLELLGDYVPQPEPGDMQVISAPIDFLGINYYNRSVVESSDANPPLNYSEVKPKGSQYTDMGWEVSPDALRELLVRLHKEYPLPAYYITENGAAYPDVPSADGKVHDPARVDYLQAHFDAARQALEAGVPLKGYFVWSLMDNFEWAWGYSKRFGIIYVDYKTQERIWKSSALWYRDWIEANKKG